MYLQWVTGTFMYPKVLPVTSRYLPEVLVDLVASDGDGRPDTGSWRKALGNSCLIVCLFVLFCYVLFSFFVCLFDYRHRTGAGLTDRLTDKNTD